MGRVVLLLAGLSLSGTAAAQGGGMGPGMMGYPGPMGPAMMGAVELQIPDAALDVMAERMVGMHGVIQQLAGTQDPAERRSLMSAMEYMGLTPGQKMEGQKVDIVFIGSCTNSRIEDLREAAGVVAGRQVAESVQALVVPGSKAIKAQAEAEGLDRIFSEAGFEWRGAGCSMCLAMNDDKAGAGKYVASTSNRNFQGRQGPGSRSFLMSPIMAAAAAVNGHVVDVREMLR